MYKKEGQDIYYIVEHQSTVDLNMPYRMLRYCMELMRKIIENSTNKDEMVANIKKIIENTKDIKQLMKLKNYIIFIQKDVLQGEEEEILEMISRKVGNDQMSTLIERLRRENDAIRKEAREQAIKELKGTVVVKMLQNKETDEKIKMYTDATDEQIEQGKRQLGIIA